MTAFAVLAVLAGSAGPGLVGCASDLVRVPGGFRHAKTGYAIGIPDGAGDAEGHESRPALDRWESIRVDGAVLAYRRRGPQLMSFQVRCHRPVAKPAILARHLMIGLDRPNLLRSGPTEVAGQDGWEQVFEADLDGDSVHVKTVTVVANRCSFDFVLMVTGSLEGAEPDFDAWWATFELFSPEPDSKGS